MGFPRGKPWVFCIGKPWENQWKTWENTSGWWIQRFGSFSIIYGIILPIDSYFPRWLKPPTRHLQMEVQNAGTSSIGHFHCHV
jgi:hypothetical protein